MVHNGGYNQKVQRINEITKNYGLTKKLTDGERVEQQKEDNLIEWISYFRANPARFAVEYLNVTILKDWQQFILHMMFINTNFVWVASRGLGKTFLCWLYMIIRCILYPGTQIVYTAQTKGQAVKFMTQKVNEFRSKYPNIDCEIKNMDKGQDPQLTFWNGSTIFIAAPSENAVGFRANCLVVDEFRKVDDNILKTTFKKFLTSIRHPLFLDRKDEKNNLIYKDYPREKNIEIYISSQAPTYEQAFVRYKNAIHNMLKMNGYMALCIPYYLGVRDEVITPDIILNELKEEGADMAIFALEYECIPFGGSENAFFTADIFTKNRQIYKPFIPMTSDKFMECKGDLSKNPFYLPKVKGEVRVLCVDTALAGETTKTANANTIVECLRLIPTEIKKQIKGDNGFETKIEKYYDKQMVYIKNITGDLNPSNQAKIIKRIFHMFEADTLVIDAQGTSLGVVYALVLPVYDEEYNLLYPAYGSMNDKAIDSYCKEPEDQRANVMYNIKVAGGSAYELQHRYNIYTKQELVARRVKLPTFETNGEDYLRNNFKYEEQEARTQAEWISVYRQCDLLIQEAISLEKKMVDGGTKIILEMPKKSISKRRDRIIAFQYGLLYAYELEIQQFKSMKTTDITQYKLGVTSSRQRNNLFGNNFNRLNGFGRRR